MQVWPTQETSVIRDAITEDLTSLLSRFISSRNLQFPGFKTVWVELGLSEIHHLCPNRADSNLFIQCLFQCALDLLHTCPTGLLDEYDVRIGKLIWNIGVFYTLYTLYFTRQQCHQNIKIRVSPEIWAELLVAYEQIDVFRNGLGYHASSIFHKLLNSSAFHFAAYTGGPSLYRVATLLRVRTQLRPDISELLSNVEYIKENSKQVASIVESSPDSTTGEGFKVPRCPVSSAHDEGGGLNLPATMDESVREFLFGSNTNSDNTSTKNPQNLLETQDLQTAATANSEGSIGFLEALEKSTLEVLEQSQSISPTHESNRWVENVNIHTTPPTRNKATKKSSHTNRGSKADSPKGKSELSGVGILDQLEAATREVMGDEAVQEGVSPSEEFTDNQRPSSRAQKQKKTRTGAPGKSKRRTTSNTPSDRAPKASHAFVAPASMGGGDVLEALERSTQEVMGEFSRSVGNSSTTSMLPTESSVRLLTAQTTPQELSGNRNGDSLSILDQLEAATREVMDDEAVREGVSPSKEFTDNQRPSSRAQKQKKTRTGAPGKSKRRTTSNTPSDRAPKASHAFVAPASMGGGDVLEALERSTQEVMGEFSRSVGNSSTTSMLPTESSVRLLTAQTTPQELSGNRNGDSLSILDQLEAATREVMDDEAVREGVSPSEEFTDNQRPSSRAQKQKKTRTGAPGKSKRRTTSNTPSDRAPKASHAFVAPASMGGGDVLEALERSTQEVMGEFSRSVGNSSTTSMLPTESSVRLLTAQTTPQELSGNRNGDSLSILDQLEAATREVMDDEAAQEELSEVGSFRKRKREVKVPKKGNVHKRPKNSERDELCRKTMESRAQNELLESSCNEDDLGASDGTGISDQVLPKGNIMDMISSLENATKEILDSSDR